MIKSTMFRYIGMLLLIALTASCSADKKKHSNTNTTPSTSPSIELGFNAKGTLNSPEQLRMFDALLLTLSPELKSHLHVRVSGGTLSQKQFPADWSSYDIAGWAELQEKHGFGLVYVLNGNDTPESQAAFIQSWRDAGAQFSFLEMMNEYYLSKFQKGDTTKPGVTRQVSYTDYIQKILPSYIAPLAEMDIPVFLIFAPFKGRAKVDDYGAQWNEAVAASMKDGYFGLPLGAAIHLYFDGGAYDYAQLDRLRVLLPDGTPIAVTECGLASRTKYNYDEAGELTSGHYRKLADHLREGDYLFDHVLYNDYKLDHSATLHPNFKGLSPKGEYVMQWMREIYP